MNLALFDFDGTITTGDTFTPFLRYAIPPLRAVAGGLVLAPILVARVGFQAVRASALQELGRRYASEVLPTVVRPEALERLQWHQREGDTIAVVSAGLDVYLRPWCDGQGIMLICTELEQRRGRMTGRYRQGDCSGTKKAERIRSVFDLGRFDTVYAYGDSVEDREMLSLASRRYYRGQEVTDVEPAG